MIAIWVMALSFMAQRSIDSIGKMTAGFYCAGTNALWAPAARSCTWCSELRPNAPRRAVVLMVASKTGHKPRKSYFSNRFCAWNSSVGKGEGR
jgi:hypothetical protein